MAVSLLRCGVFLLAKLFAIYLRSSLLYLKYLNDYLYRITDRKYMNLINLLEIKSPFGYRQFKLVQGDISTIAFPVDLLCVSAFAGGYVPVKGTLLGSLYDRRSINLKELAKVPEIDLRNSQHSFFVNVKDDPYIKRILCLEMVGTNRSVEDILNSLLLSLFTAELKGIRIKSLMMPLLGTGKQQINTIEILGSLIKKMEYLLSTSPSLENVYLVAYTKDQAGMLNDTMNLLLKRSVSVFHKNQIISSVSSNIRQLMNDNPKAFTSGCYVDLINLLNEHDVNAFTLAITSRKICEHILNTILNDETSTDLAKKINLLKSTHTPPWMISYFHMLRIFGNAYAHEQHPESNSQMNEQDIVITLFSVERVIEYYLEKWGNSSSSAHI